MENDDQISVFIAHAWRDHIDRTALVRILGETRRYVNTGVLPDGGSLPAPEARAAECDRAVASAEVVLVLAATYLETSSRPEVRRQIDCAQRFGKPIVVLTAYGTTDVPAYLYERADEIVYWRRSDAAVWERDEVEAAVEAARRRSDS